MQTLLEYIKKTKVIPYIEINNHMTYDEMLNALEKTSLLNLSCRRYLSKGDLIEEFLKTGQTLFYTMYNNSSNIRDIVLCTEEGNNIVMYDIEESARSQVMGFVYIYKYDKTGNHQLSGDVMYGNETKEVFYKINMLLH